MLILKTVPGYPCTRTGKFGMFDKSCTRASLTLPKFAGPQRLTLGPRASMPLSPGGSPRTACLSTPRAWMSTRCPRSRWRSLGVHAQLPAKGPRDRRRFRRCLHWPPGPVVDDAPTCASGSRLVPAGEARLLHPCCTNDAIAQRVQQPRGSGGAVHLRCARSQRLHGKRRSAGRDQQRAARRAPQELPLTTLRAQKNADGSKQGQYVYF